MLVQFWAAILLISVSTLWHVAAGHHGHETGQHSNAAAKRLVQLVIERHEKSSTKCSHLFEKLCQQVRQLIVLSVCITGDVQHIIGEIQRLIDIHWHAVQGEIEANNEWALQHAEQVIPAMFETLPLGVQQMPLAQFYRDQSLATVYQNTEQALSQVAVQRNEVQTDAEGLFKQMHLIRAALQANPDRVDHYQALLEAMFTGWCDVVRQTAENLPIAELINNAARRVHWLFQAAQSLNVKN